MVARIGAYVLDGNAEFRSLLQYIVTSTTACNTLVIITLDMSRPWTLVQSLERWFRLLGEHFAAVGSAELDEQKAKSNSDPSNRTHAVF